MNKPIVLAMLLVACLLSACSEDAPTSNVQSNQMTASIDGAAWTSTSITASKFADQSVVIAQGPNGSVLTLALGTVAAPGTYEFGTSHTSATYAVGQNAYLTALTTDAGTLTVTGFDATHVAGTFSFTAKNTNNLSIAVTSGTFHVSFQ